MWRNHFTQIQEKLIRQQQNTTTRTTTTNKERNLKIQKE